MILVSCNLSQNGFKNFGTDTVYYLHHINCISKLHVPYLLSPWRPGVGGDPGIHTCMSTCPLSRPWMDASPTIALAVHPGHED